MIDTPEKFAIHILGKEKYDHSPCQAHPYELIAAEVELLREVINRAAKAWMSLEPPVAWEGDVADAMAAGVAEIARLRDKTEGLQELVRDAYREGWSAPEAFTYKHRDVEVDWLNSDAKKELAAMEDKG